MNSRRGDERVPEWRGRRAAIAGVALLVAAFFGAPAGAETKPRLARAVSPPFGLPSEIEVLQATTDDVDAAIAAAFERIEVIEGYTERAVTDQLSIDAIGAPTNTARDLFHVLQRAKSFCEWSEGAITPLSGQIYDLWSRTSALPHPDDTRSAVESARCEALDLNPEGEMVQVAAGSRIDLRDFAAGFAVDAAIDVLKERGATNARVQIGQIHRAIGPGRTGRGWQIPIPQLTRPGPTTETMKPVVLLDEALVVTGLRPPSSIAGDYFSAYIDARNGRPVNGVVGVLTVTELALDAQGLSTALYVAGSHEGELRLGVLRPPPAVMWLLGTPDAPPLISTYQWSRR